MHTQNLKGHRRLGQIASHAQRSAVIQLTVREQGVRDPRIHAAMLHIESILVGLGNFVTGTAIENVKNSMPAITMAVGYSSHLHIRAEQALADIGEERQREQRAEWLTAGFGRREPAQLRASLVFGLTRAIVRMSGVYFDLAVVANEIVVIDENTVATVQVVKESSDSLTGCP